jgi:nicotinamide-nucleotide amidase
MKREERILANFLKEHKLKIAFAESMTCGLLAHKLGTVNGTADFFSGSIVCYDPLVKTKLLKIKKRLIERYTCESQQVTDALAFNLRKIIPADVHAALTGLAAAGGSESRSKPVGTVFYSVVLGKRSYKMRKIFKGSPLQIRKRASAYFFKFIYDRLKKYKRSKSGS